MTKIRRLSVIAAMTFISAIAVPRMSDAQSVSGTWTGVESFSQVISEPGGQIMSESSGSNVPAVLSMTFSGFSYPQALDMSVLADYGGFDISVFGPVYPLEPLAPLLNPQSADGNVVNFDQHRSQEWGFFALTYQSILPDGNIDTTGGSAFANFHFSAYSDSENLYYSGFGQFQSQDLQGVPEPSSIVLAVTAAMIGLIFAWVDAAGPLSAIFVWYAASPYVRSVRAATGGR